ncbi:MAG: DUF2608 domain-containing protein [Oligoflexales bacterium]|nr:DUF2608 domain-containing protein [Oligoflexales bacterium]
MLLSTQAQAKIFEKKMMRDAFSLAEKDSVVVLDIDNTILRPSQSFGSVEWYDHAVSELRYKYQSQGLSSSLAELRAQNETIKIWEHVNAKTKVIPVEREIPALVAQLQKEGRTVIALTARRIDYDRVTFLQLKSVGIDFNNNPHAMFTKQPTFKDTKFMNGVFFSGHLNDKGEVFVNFLNENKLKPRSVLFIDDKDFNVKSLEKSLTPTSIEYFGVRYSGADPFVNSLNPQVVALQYKSFLHEDKLLADEEALRLIRKK